MPGANCSIFGCSTSRKTKNVGIFKIPSASNQEWRSVMLNIITKDRVVDAGFKQQISNNTVYVCEKHFSEDEIYRCKYFYYHS